MTSKPRNRASSGLLRADQKVILGTLASFSGTATYKSVLVARTHVKTSSPRANGEKESETQSDLFDELGQATMQGNRACRSLRILFCLFARIPSERRRRLRSKIRTGFLKAKSVLHCLDRNKMERELLFTSFDLEFL